MLPEWIVILVMVLMFGQGFMIGAFVGRRAGGRFGDFVDGYMTAFWPPSYVRMANRARLAKEAMGKLRR